MTWCLHSSESCDFKNVKSYKHGYSAPTTTVEDQGMTINPNVVSSVLSTFIHIGLRGCMFAKDLRDDQASGGCECLGKALDGHPWVNVVDGFILQ